MQKVYEARATAEANLALFEQSVALPAYFANEVDAIKIYFEFISKSTQFVEDTITLTDSQQEILSYISKFVQTEIDTCKTLKSDVATLQSEVASFEGYAAGVFNKIPSIEVISDFAYRIQEYSYQAYKLLKSFRFS